MSAESRRELLLLDGSMSCQLSCLGYDVNEHKPHWTFPANDDPQLMEAVYRSFLSLDVNVITTNTYHYGSTLDKSLVESEDQKMRFLKQFKNTCQQLRSIVNRSECRSCEVWGSVGTLATMYHDLSEYTGSYMDKVDSMEIAEQYYSKILQIFRDETEIRQLIFETISSEKEAKAAMNVLKRFPCFKAIISFTFMENARLRHGEKIHNTAEEMENCSQIVGIGINCTDPINVLPALIDLQKYKFGEIFVSPNSGDNSFLSEKNEKKCSFSKETILAWTKSGATGIGGCCGVNENQLKMLKKLIDDFNSKTS